MTSKRMATCLLPQRWLYCPPMGKMVANKFLPMKTPLDECYDENEELDEEHYRFHPADVFRLHPNGNRVGLWLDFTNTHRYYNSSDVDTEADGEVKYEKIPLQGHGKPPSEEEVQRFIDCVKKFFESLDYPDSSNHNTRRNLVAMHCTHGFNRTGFLIAAYLHREECYGIEAAVEEFRKCRPDGIYKQDYLDELWRRYGDDCHDCDGEGENAAMEAGRMAGGKEINKGLKSRGRPQWESGPIADEDYYFGGYPSVATTGVSRCSGDPTQPPRFMDGRVPAVTYVESAKNRAILQKKVHDMLGYRGRGFPGSQPVSLEGPHGKNNIRLLAQHDYMVSWKADGVRYLVLIVDEEQVYAFDRDNNVFHIPGVRFPNAEDLSHHLCNTILDAEMVIDEFKGKDGDPNIEVPRLLIYDIMCLDGENVGKWEYPKRFGLIRSAVYDPRIKAMKAGRIVRERECMGIRRKDFWPLAQACKLLDKQFLSNLHHGADGLIFQPCDKKMPYTPGKCEWLLKWKPPDFCTVDFRLDLRRGEARPGELRTYSYELSVLHSQQPFARIPAKSKELLKYDGKIVECSYERKTGEWVVMRERTDKSFPNAYETAMSVWNTIRYPITVEYLLGFIGEIGNMKKRLLTTTSPSSSSIPANPGARCHPSSPSSSSQQDNRPL